MKRNNTDRITKTFSIPPKEIKEIEEILNFCKEHDINYSALIRKSLKHWYKKNKKYIMNNIIYKESDIPLGSPS